MKMVRRNDCAAMPAMWLGEVSQLSLCPLHAAFHARRISFETWLRQAAWCCVPCVARSSDRRLMNIACKIREFLGVLVSWVYLLVPQPQPHHSKRYIDRSPSADRGSGHKAHFRPLMHLCTAGAELSLLPQLTKATTPNFYKTSWHPPPSQLEFISASSNKIHATAYTYMNIAIHHLYYYRILKHYLVP